MSKTIESHERDIIEAARAWRNSFPGFDGYVDDHHQNHLQGYLYDRVRRYEQALEAQAKKGSDERQWKNGKNTGRT